ncbi:MAG: hypothetical protein ACI8UO_001550 [Verrucomicrobiales bacterium]|jgi:hypothetical protein
MAADPEHPIHRHFDQIYVIAIQERLERVLRVLGEMGIQPEVFEATWRDDLPPLPQLLADRVVTPRFFLNLFPDELVSVPNIGETINAEFLADRPDDFNSVRGKIALHLTRIRLCKKFLDTDAPSMFLFEDDIAPQADLDAHHRDFAAIFDQQLPADWDLVNLGRCFDLCAANVRFSENLVTETFPFCAHALAISRRVAKQIIERTLPMFHSGDAMFREVLYQDPNLATFSSINALFRQERGQLGSMLGNTQQELPECVQAVPPSLRRAKDWGLPIA